MAKKSIADLDFDWNEGELELTGFGEDDEFEEEEELLEEDEVEEEIEEEEDDVEEESSVTVRLTNLEKTIQSLPQMIANSIASALNKNVQKEEEEEEIPDELDNKQIVNILAKRMQKSVKETVSSAVKEMHDNDPAIRSARVTEEFRQCQMKYGQKFVDRAVPVAQIMARAQAEGGRISAEAAFLSIANLPAPQAKTKQGQKTVTRKPVKVDADASDSIGSINEPVRPKFDAKKIKETTDADYFQQSWNAGLMSAVRSARQGRRRA